ncbi:iron-siderophore ABC transporter substrate-binding protein [Alkalihalobacillus sp. MEB130]|uniref:iron-siderophore ABC transporter substrate-binding protein n=1 Tax=Alkalihalobacillus sp. MEB130 TaxID=2976704 RepID=UPI0028DE702C|nr:iron-siderophore ABC transporter substrate-binding protein [Alkalihalobacillus sp. MEB130]MDT8861969.1 iron-siderophore ABC transporter substrate-binding protein [Alkalihalobacillus sp. MEB130]
MKTKRKVSLLTALLVAILMFALVGCSTQQSNSQSEPTSTEDPNTEIADTEVTTSDYPIVINHALGETVIEEKPERVVTISWANHDVVLALGVVPVGFSAANYGVQDDSGMLPWTAEKLKKLSAEQPNIFQDTDGLDFEAISDAKPDVILASYSGITQEEYETLSQIAPVVAYETGPWVTSWRDQITLNSMGMGMAEEGKQLIADTEQLIEDKANEHPEIKGKKAAFAMINAADLSKFYVYTPADPRGEFLGELGMEYPESIMSEIADSNSFYIELSAENADALNDVEVLISYGDENSLTALQADPILGKVPAIERGSVVIIGDNTPLAAAGTPNPLSIQYSIDEYVTLISEAVSKLE